MIKQGRLSSRHVVWPITLARYKVKVRKRNTIEAPNAGDMYRGCEGGNKMNEKPSDRHHEQRTKCAEGVPVMWLIGLIGTIFIKATAVPCVWEKPPWAAVFVLWGCTCRRVSECNGIRIEKKLACGKILMGGQCPFRCETVRGWFTLAVDNIQYITDWIQRSGSDGEIRAGWRQETSD